MLQGPYALLAPHGLLPGEALEIFFHQLWGSAKSVFFELRPLVDPYICLGTNPLQLGMIWGGP